MSIKLRWILSETHPVCKYLDDPISMIENTPEYNSMQDSDLPFLQASLNFANPKRGKDRIQIMIFANPALLGMLKIPALDVFVDATFDCCPNSFYQCLIFMIYDHATSSYVPILYALMTSKCKEAYWQVFNQVVVLSQ